MVPSGSSEPVASTLQVRPVQVTVKAAVGTALLNACTILVFDAEPFRLSVTVSLTL